MPSKSIPWSRLGAEFVVIFVGVTLSLLADDWRNERESRAAEQTALGELRADLLADSAAFSTTLAHLERLDQSAVWIRRHLRDASVHPDSALHHLRYLGFGARFYPNAASYSGLRAAGQVSLLSDPEVRRGVVAYYEQTLPRIVQLDDFFVDVQRDYVDVVFDHALTPLPDSATSSWVAEGLVFTSSWDAFRRDTRVEPTVTLLGLSAGSWVVVARSAMEANSRLVAAIRRVSR